MSRKLLAKVAVPTFFSLALVMSSGGRAVAIEVKNNVPQAIQQATDLGPLDPAKELNITVRLKMADKAAFDKAVADLYNPASPKYEHWMTNDDLKAYAPPASQLTAVQKELEKNGLSVVSIDPLGFSIRVHGTVANVQKAFQTEIHQYKLNQRSFQAHISEARLTGGADAYVSTVAGLDGGQAKPMAKRATNPKTGAEPKPILVKDADPGSLFNYITDSCFKSPKAWYLPSQGAQYPIGVYAGNDYDDTYYNGTQKACTFTPAQLQSHYGLPAAYTKGYDGTGESIVLLEAYGYPTIMDDANAFSKLSGLPALNSTNFEIVYPEGKPANPNAGVLVGWDVEIALDVQWAHSIAPKAKIIVVAAAGQDNEDFQDAINYVTANGLAHSVSDSWETDLDSIAGPLEIESFNAVLEEAAAKGISVNFSSGDGGDDGLGSPIGSAEVPSESPWATAVGGTSILNAFNGSNIETGWGTSIAFIDDLTVDDPPSSIFDGGSGGGESIHVPKPSWQSALPGTGRQVPDVSALSDPFTGVFIILTVNGTTYFEPGWGGTSLGCPIFSAFWTLANQAAGHALGQAAPKIAAATGKQLTDIVPHTSPTNLSGLIIDSTGTTPYTSFDIFASALDPNTTEFISAMWPFGYYAFDAVSFGTDSSLTVTAGWDNVTGFGVPNGLTFIEGFK